MKRFLLMLLISSTTAHAEDVPSYLRDGEIEVHLKGGTTDKFSTNQYKVVPRSSSKKVQAMLDDLRKQLADCQAQRDAIAAQRDTMAAQLGEQPTEVVREVVKEVAPADRLNRIAFGVGVGPDGVSVTETKDEKVVSPRTAPLVTIAYARKLSAYSPWNLGVQGSFGISPQSRTLTGLLNLGYDF